MKRFLLSIVALFAMIGFVGAETYTYTFEKEDVSTDGGTILLGDYEWTMSSAGYIGFDSSNGRGVQIGSRTTPCPSYSISTSAFAEFTIKSITVNSSIASSGDAKMTIKVGEHTSESYELTTKAADYTFDCEDTKGDIVISWSATQRAYYVKSITVEYVVPAGMVEVPAPVFNTAEGIYADYVKVRATSEDMAAVIYYTVDGSEPDYENVNGNTLCSGYYVIEHTLTESATVKAMAVLTDGDEVYKSKVVSASYVVSPTKPYVPATNVGAGSYALFADSCKVARPISSSKEYGYIGYMNATVHNRYIESMEYNALSFVATDGGYTIQDALGRYIYMTGDYNSFNVSAEKPASGAVWSVNIDADGYVHVKNVEKNKTIRYSNEYASFGCYSDEAVTDTMELPRLYKMREYPQATVTPASKSVLETLQTITITCEEGIKPSDDFKADAQLVDSQVTMKCSQVNTNTITLSFDEPLKTVNALDLMIFISGSLYLDPDGMCRPMEFYQSRLDYTLTATAPPATIEEITPADNAVLDSLSYVLFTFSYYCGRTDDEAIAPKLYNVETPEQLIPVEFTTYSEDGAAPVAQMQCALKVTEAATAAGTYILDVPTGYFIDGNGKSVEGVKLTYKVTGNFSSVDEVLFDVDGVFTVYNVAGVKVLETKSAAQVQSLPAGLYIVNGVKMIIK